MDYGKIRLTLRFDVESNHKTCVYISSTQRLYSVMEMPPSSFIIQLFLSKLSCDTFYRQIATVVAYEDRHSLVTPYDMRGYFRYKVFSESASHSVHLTPRSNYFMNAMALFEKSIANGKMPLMLGSRCTRKVSRVKRKK